LNLIVSIICPVYNKQKFITETINSVINQTYIFWELLIIDDCSTDNTINIINKYIGKNSNIKLFINLSNKGANYSRNFGIKNAIGKYVIFLDADDVLSKDCLFNRMHFFENNIKCDFVVSTLQVFNSLIGDNNYLWKPTKNNALKKFLSHNLPWQTMQPTWKKEFLLETKGFDEKFLRLQDVEFHTTVLLQHYANFEIISLLPDCYYRIDEDRKNFNTSNFLTRWVDAANQYCTKINLLLPQNLKKYLRGTIFHAYFQVLYNFRLQKISFQEFISLEKSVQTNISYSNLNYIKKKLFTLTKIYNLYCFRIPGFNRLLLKLIIS